MLLLCNACPRMSPSAASPLPSWPPSLGWPWPLLHAAGTAGSAPRWRNRCALGFVALSGTPSEGVLFVRIQRLPCVPPSATGSWRRDQANTPQRPFVGKGPRAWRTPGGRPTPTARSDRRRRARSAIAGSVPSSISSVMRLACVAGRYAADRGHVATDAAIGSGQPAQSWLGGGQGDTCGPAPIAGAESRCDAEAEPSPRDRRRPAHAHARSSTVTPTASPHCAICTAQARFLHLLTAPQRESADVPVRPAA